MWTSDLSLLLSLIKIISSTLRFVPTALFWFSSPKNTLITVFSLVGSWGFTNCTVPLCYNPYRQSSLRLYVKSHCKINTCLDSTWPHKLLGKGKENCQFRLTDRIMLCKGRKEQISPGTLDHNVTQTVKSWSCSQQWQPKGSEFHTLQQRTAVRITTPQVCACIDTYVLSYLNLHCLRLYNMDFVLVATPDSIIDHSHATDGVVSVAKIHQVVITEIPLTIWGEKQVWKDASPSWHVSIQQNPLPFYIHLGIQA